MRPSDNNVTTRTTRTFMYVLVRPRSPIARRLKSAISYRALAEEENRVGHHGHNEEARIIPAEGSRARDGDASSHSQDAAGPVPLRQPDHLDQLGDHEQITHGHQ